MITFTKIIAAKFTSHVTTRNIAIHVHTYSIVNFEIFPNTKFQYLRIKR